jgi:hypothetical protein
MRPIVPLLAVLIAGGAFAALAAPAANTTEVQRAASAKASVTRALTVLQKSDAPFARQAVCASCHTQVQPFAAAVVAKGKGIASDEAVMARQQSTILAELDARREGAYAHAPQGGFHAVLAGLLDGAGTAKMPPNEATDGAALYIMGKQSANGSWNGVAVRFPSGATDFGVTARAVRALDLYAPPSMRREADTRIARARTWLEATPAGTHIEGLAGRLSGLANAHASPRLITAARAELIAAQHQDGGWSQRPELMPDAYATALALNALADAKTKPTEPAYARGVDWLIATQDHQGAWHVKARALPIQPKLDSGFPYGADQWISATATSMAASALAYALP